MTRFAAIDCGTNSIRLLISDVRDVGGVLEFTELHRVMEIVRLGQRVDETGEITSEALQRVEQALHGFTDLMDREGVTQVRMVATSAARDAKNRDEFFALTERALKPWGAQAEVITGAEEARLSFRGAVDDLDPATGPFAVIDIGGGSTEVIVGDSDGTILGSTSEPMGSVRLTERFLQDSPPTDDQLAAAREYVADLAERIIAEVPVNKAQTVVGCAGTFTTLSAVAQGLETYDPAQIHLSRLRCDALRSLNESLLRQSSEILAADPVMHPGRADVFAGGLVVVDAIMDICEGADEVVISEKDILDGIIAGLVDSAS
ncbi:Ppx/GppA family phosphatase [Corynebacterium sp. TAE3-ERU12]|uniref:Ppx/GppA phosphatase family protein n=1 Tax=Corynebacterium sp. TAE3-ERU12 TaxID=2849491 RepID=UPI001C4482FF|nr:Ppx/GppA phosphatase family protein [Corynebacterium sp. TAE3-ERU12]MBV7295696.1 Ppx/GppA family phosphatase [Corynebacterium sp. TAE3-ERU12]